MVLFCLTRPLHKRVVVNASARTDVVNTVINVLCVRARWVSFSGFQRYGAIRGPIWHHNLGQILVETSRFDFLKIVLLFIFILIAGKL